ncbi:MAG: efflux RND transporter periplasmic adaptor subunit, partial [Sphingobacteriales bacterium]
QIASTNRGIGGSTQVSTTDVTNYEVRIRLDASSYQDLIDPSKPKNFPFRPGMSASADIQTKTHVNVLAVPINAVTTRDKGDTGIVAVKEKKEEMKSDEKNEQEEMNAVADEPEEVVFILQSDNTVKRVAVRTDIQDMSHIEVLSGLKEGDQVITGPYTVVSKLLRNGMKVKVVPKEELFEVKKK